MRQSRIFVMCLAGAVALSACAPSEEEEVERAFEAVNAIDDSNLSALMLTSADTEEAVNFFRRSVAEKPDRIDLRRGLALSLVRAKQARAAVPVWKEVIAHPDSNNDDRVELADAQIRAGEWDAAAAALGTIPPTHETFKRYRLEAMVADSREDWKKADSFYEVALGLTTQPSGVLNNWGYSKLTRGEHSKAERLFAEALTYDNELFTAKNNLVLARAAQRNYQLPVLQLDQVERAQLLHTMGLAAIKQGDVAIGRGLLQDAIESHPQYFEAAVRSLDALESGVLQ